MITEKAAEVVAAFFSMRAASIELMSRCFGAGLSSDLPAGESSPPKHEVRRWERRRKDEDGYTSVIASFRGRDHRSLNQLQLIKTLNPYFS